MAHSICNSDSFQLHVFIHMNVFSVYNTYGKRLKVHAICIYQECECTVKIFYICSVCTYVLPICMDFVYTKRHLHCTWTFSMSFPLRIRTTLCGNGAGSLATPSPSTHYLAGEWEWRKWINYISVCTRELWMYVWFRIQCHAIILLSLLCIDGKLFWNVCT